MPQKLFTIKVNKFSLKRASQLVIFTKFVKNKNE